MVLRSDGTARALLDVVATAVGSAGYPITRRSYSDLTLRFELRGVTWNSFVGDVTTDTQRYCVGTVTSPCCSSSCCQVSKDMQNRPPTP